MTMVMHSISTLRVIAVGLIIILTATMLPAPRPVAAETCGIWSESVAAEEGRFEVRTATTRESSLANGCSTVVEITNTSAVAGLIGGYSMEMKAAGQQNMSVTWESFGERYSQQLFLTQLFVSEADAAVRDVSTEAAAAISAQVTVPSLALDTIVFIIQSFLEALPTTCVVSTTQLFLIAYELMPEAMEAAKHVANFDYSKALNIFPAVFERVADRAEDIAADVVTGCVVDVAKLFLSAGVVVILKIAANYLTWIPKVFVDYFGYGGRAAEARVSFEPLAQPTATATATSTPTPEPTATQTPEPPTATPVPEPPTPTSVPPQPPAAPSNVRFTIVPGAPGAPNPGLLIEWNDNSDNELGFEIYDSIREIVVLGTVMTNTTSYFIMNLDRTRWCYDVRSFNEVGLSAFASELDGEMACGGEQGL